MAANVSTFAVGGSWFPRWRLPLFALGLGLGVAVVGGFLGWRAVHGARVRVELEQFIAGLDRDEPGWRIKDLVAARAKVPDKQNNAHAIGRAAKKLLPFGEKYSRFVATMNGLAPNVRLDDDQYGYCINLLETMEATVWDLETIARLPCGHIAVDADRAANALLPLVNLAERLTPIPLYVLILVHGHEGNYANGLRMCTAHLHMAAAVGDEPYIISEGARRRLAVAAVVGLERLLGQGALSDQELAGFHGELTTELACDPWPLGLRGERAWKHEAFVSADDGQVTMSQLRDMRPGGHTPKGWAGTFRAWVGDQFPANMDGAHLWVLQRETQLLRATTGVPWHVRLATIEAFAAAQLEAPEDADVGVRLADCFKSLQVLEARLRCAAPAVAAERYRLRYGRWPEVLDTLVPEFLPAVEMDPFDGRALRCRRVADGFVVYAVGPDGKDDGGNFTNSAIPPDRVVPVPEGTDVGFRLWDPAYRGLPAVH
jgi:hypothetical protein